MTFESSQGGYLISDDPARLDLRATHAYLSRSYWAAGIPFEIVERMVRHSMCFGLYDQAHDLAQIGFGRVISDRATFAYVSDIYVLEEHRGRGLAQRLVRFMRAHPDLQGLRLWLLYTRDAHGVYQKVGFAPTKRAEWIMEIPDPDVYRRPTLGYAVPPRQTSERPAAEGRGTLDS